jgi:DNA-binding response OmpR family regulator
MVILVVEDEAIIGFCLTHVLEEAGHFVEGPALSSSEALALARANPPDLALIDIDLESPGSGICLARKLCEQYGCVIIFTTGQPEIARTHADCAIGMIAKPYDPGEVPALVSYAEALVSGARVRPPAHARSFERFEHHPAWLRRHALRERSAFIA